MTGRLMDIDELAERLNVPKSWVRDAVTARRIPVRWIGRHARFGEDDFEAIASANHETPTTPRQRGRSASRSDAAVVVDFQPRPSRRSA